MNTGRPMVSQRTSMIPRSARLAVLSLACGLAAARAEKLTVAAATNLTYAVAALNAAYQQANPADRITPTIADSDDLFTQIKAGAPADVFLAADVEYPQKLVDAGLARADSIITYATGRLALYTLNPDLDVTNVDTVLADPRVKHIAIPDPLTAPYGHAAKQTLLELEIWDQSQSRLVVTPTLEKAEEAVIAGRADVGFVALSLMLSPTHKNKGAYHEVPPELYDPLDQGAVITKQGETNPAAKRYLAFLKTRAAKDVLRKFGYDVPAFESGDDQP